MKSIRHSLLLAVSLAGALHAQEAPKPSDLRYYYPPAKTDSKEVIEVDVCVYGGTSGGVTAAVQAARMGKKAVLVELGRHVGGMTAGGLSHTDGGHPSITGGLAGEFYKKMGKRRGFRPSEAENAYLAMLKEAGVKVLFEHPLKSAEKNGSRITEIVIENGTRIRAKQFIDATYEGDLMAAAGVSYTVGRESNSQYGETINGVIYGPKDNFDKPVDPYVKPGDPSSGLLPGITNGPPGKVGEGDKLMQAYNFRMWLEPAENAIPWPKPAGYDAGRYALLVRYIEAGCHHTRLHQGDNNNHHMFNGAYSTDNIGMNHRWPEAGHAEREKIFQDHVTYQQGLMYFLANDPQVPDAIREKVKAWGLPKDEFTGTGGWPHQLYVREARRMVSDYVMTQHHGRGEVVAEDSISIASYQMDSHNTARVVVDGKVQNEGQTYENVARPLPLSYRAITPKESECTNLSVIFCVSASHIGLSTLRMEPVLMITGQSAGTAAALAIDEGCSLQKLPYPKLRDRLLADGQILVPPPPKPKEEKKAK
ncbi:MAG: FAD-dependent oxidoreductase [Akkermansiaceae bacterium]|nr:FAD-dependent oxidoreductase [Akkermansiaceae bacterium]